MFASSLFVKIRNRLSMFRCCRPSEVVFHYYDGRPVEQGDMIKTGNVYEAVVELIIQPGSEDATAYGCEETGGVLILEKWSSGDGYMLVTPPDGIYWEDIEFISSAP